MAIRFTQGASVATTRSIAADRKVAPPQKNTMKGLPGFIKTKQDPSSSGLTGRVGGGRTAKASGFKGHGPHREGAVPGRKLDGTKGVKRMNDSTRFGGSADNHYRQTSTGPAGKVVSNKTASVRKPVDQRAYGSPHGGARSFKQQTGQNASFATGGVGAGHPGRMESLRGKARMSGER